MAKHILHNNEDLIDFVLIGISCAENQYLVCQLLNEALTIKLFLSDFIPFNLKEGKLFRFSLFRYLDEQLALEYYLVPNRSNFENPLQHQNTTNDLFAGMDVEERLQLIAELPKTDYFLILKGEDLHNHQFKIMELLKHHPDIIQVQAIEPKELPSRRNLIF